MLIPRSVLHVSVIMVSRATINKPQLETPLKCVVLLRPDLKGRKPPSVHERQQVWSMA